MTKPELITSYRKVAGGAEPPAITISVTWL